MATKDAAAASLEFTDQGPGVRNREKAPYSGALFRLQNAGGPVRSGLGLAIAARAVAAHECKPDLLENDTCGLRVRLTRPVRPSAVPESGLLAVNRTDFRVIQTIAYPTQSIRALMICNPWLRTWARKIGRTVARRVVLISSVDAWVMLHLHVARVCQCTAVLRTRRRGGRNPPRSGQIRPWRRPAGRGSPVRDGSQRGHATGRDRPSAFRSATASPPVPTCSRPARSGHPRRASPAQGS